MRKFLFVIVMFLVIAGSFLAGTWYSRHSRGANSAAASRRVLYYRDPMHPAYKSDKPGIAPDCGMQLEPVYADDQSSSEGVEARASMPPGTVQLSQFGQQLIGVRFATVEKAPQNHTIRILGRVVPDETRVYRINSAIDGWVKEISAITTGTLVKKDELLATIFAPESASAIKAYLYGLRSLDRFQANAKETKEQIEVTDSTIDNYRNALRNLGMTEYQLDEIQRTRQPASAIDVRAPASGFILARNISLGQRFERGTELYRIADLSHVWIMADLFGREAKQMQPGVPVRVSLADQGLALTARISDVLPQFDPLTRTLKVRLDANNPGYELRPDMFVNVDFPVHLAATLAIPSEAVLDTGVRKIVFVDRGSGFFEPRRIETGWRVGDRVEVTKGLMEGERIVVSGNFLLDSESRLKLVAAGLPEDHVLDAVCGMGVDPHKTALITNYRGQAYYFCSTLCKENFDKHPEQYANKERGAGAALP